MTFHVPDDDRRIRQGPFATDAKTHGNNGAFLVERPKALLRCIASDGAGWEHVSVSLPNRCPTWAEMHYVKTLFWDAEDAVMQLHPPESNYVNCHPYCLHLWRPTNGAAIPLPPSLLVGPRSAIKEPA